MEWAKVEGKESDLDYLLSFLKGEIQRRERSQTFSSSNLMSGTGAQGYKRTRNAAHHSSEGTAAALVSVSSCYLCGKPHPTEKCWQWRKMNYDERLAKFKELGLCFKCLNKNCFSKCNKLCSNEGCVNGRHHFLLCKKKFDKRNNNSDKDHENPKGGNIDPALLSANSHDHQVFMQMARVPVIDKLGKTEMANILFDTGSNKTYISGEFVRKVKPKYEGSEQVNYIAFGSKETGKPS